MNVQYFSLDIEVLPIGPDDVGMTERDEVAKDKPVAGFEHQAANDSVYWARRAALNEVARFAPRDGKVPQVTYLEEEDRVWSQVREALAPRHERFACRSYLEAVERIGLPRDHVPQLGDVAARLGTLSRFSIRPVGGLVPIREFYGPLSERTFCSTLYVRHPSAPYYTPEPDVVHELIGHATMLADPALAELHERAGRASLRTESEAALEYFSRVFWFTLEFGVVLEAGEPKAYGAGLLSSCGEIEVFSGAELRPFDLAEMGRRDYDITHFQPVLYVAPSFTLMLERLGAFFDSYGEGTYEALRRGRAA
jgi:phenylalanine-4-hydroxylase